MESRVPYRHQRTRRMDPLSWAGARTLNPSLPFANGGFDSDAGDSGSFGGHTFRQTRQLGPPRFAITHRQPPIHARSSPSPPPTMPVSPRADTLLELRLGRGWWLHPEGRRLAENFLRENWLRHSINDQLFNWDRLDSVPARERRIQPHLSVDNHWRIVRETPLRYPELPAVIQERAVRGTSRQSIARQRRTGIPTWPRGAPHFDFFPLEDLEVEPPDPIYRAPHSSYEDDEPIPLHRSGGGPSPPMFSPMPHKIPASFVPIHSSTIKTEMNKRALVRPPKTREDSGDEDNRIFDPLLGFPIPKFRFGCLLQRAVGDRRSDRKIVLQPSLRSSLPVSPFSRPLHRRAHLQRSYSPAICRCLNAPYYPRRRPQSIQFAAPAPPSRSNRRLPPTPLFLQTRLSPPPLRSALAKSRASRETPGLILFTSILLFLPICTDRFRFCATELIIPLPSSPSLTLT
ncbi:hypothetical protein niasHT_026135 [Heterodera trifolii]|uniref:Uncharacterized protein n=1 Tax=Heterodera trifolii TaxID=157864 RepID=A0ABD2JZX2_9BILA